MMKKNITGLRSALSSRGFHLTKFTVNDEEVRHTIPECDRSDNQDIMVSHDSNHKVLGVGLSVSTDSFYFEVHVDVNCSSSTKSQMLSIVATISDPFGLISPITVTGIMLFQQANKLKINWRQELPQELQAKWIAWLITLDAISSLMIPRCIKPKLFDDSHVELHAFCDASEWAYGCCFYMRSINRHGEIHIALVCGKSRLTPIKTVSIPRLELQAACLAASIEYNLRTELSDVALSCTTFWSDSEIVLAYIRNRTRRFHVFVANINCSIHNTTDPTQWNHIDGKQNPEDLLTRGITITPLTNLWFHGPSFHQTHKSKWVVSDHLLPEIPIGDPELRKTITTLQCTIPDAHPVDRIIMNYSDWSRMIKAVAWLIQCRNVLLERDTYGVLVSKNLQQAENIIIHHVQFQAYPDDISGLSNNQALLKSSNLRSLMHRLDDEGLLVVSGRLKQAEMPLHHREPYVIPHNSDVSVKIARYYHNMAHHGVEWTLSDIRERFWITNAMVVVKRVKEACLTCKRLYTSVNNQQMADLSRDRIIIGQPPFTITGCDWFGPYKV